MGWGVGWAIVYLLSFVANQFGALKLDTTFFVVLSGALAVPTLALFVLNREKLRSLLRPPFIPPDLRQGVGLASLCALAVFVGLVFYKGVTIPPASTDAIVYHLRLPKLAFETGTLAAEAGIGWLELTSALPNLLIAQQLWVYLGAAQFDELFVRPIVPIYSSLLLLIVFSDSRRLFGVTPALLAAACLFSLNEFASLTIVMWSEIPVAFYAYLAVRTFFWNSDRWSSLFVAGSFAGVSAMVKYNGLLVALALAAAILLLAFWHRGAKPEKGRSRWVLNGISRAGLFLLIAGLVAAPFLVRNWLAFGNPVYPFFFGGINTAPIAYYYEDFSAQDVSRFHVHKVIVVLGSILIAGIGVGLLRIRQWSTVERFLLSVLVLYLPIYAYFASAGSHVRYFAPVIPVAATLAGRQLAWWIGEANRQDQIRGCYVVFGLIGSVLFLTATTDVSPPYLMQSVVAFTIVAIVAILLVAIQRWLRRSTVKTVSAIALAVALIIPGALAVVGEKYPPRESAWDISLLPPDREAYLEARFGDDWRMWNWINANLPTEALILTFEPRLLYLERNVTFAADHELDATYSMPLDQAVAFVQGLGVDYVLDSPWSHVPIVNQIFLRRSVLFLNLNDQTLFRVVHAEGDTILYTFV